MDHHPVAAKIQSRDHRDAGDISAASAPPIMPGVQRAARRVASDARPARLTWADHRELWLASPQRGSSDAETHLPH